MSKTKNACAKQTFQSKQRISDALMRLMEKDSFDQITITQICQEAQVTRQTYYRNFKSKEDIIHFVIHNYLNDYFNRHGTIREIPSNLKVLFEEFTIHNDFLRLINKSNLVYLIQNELSTYIMQDSNYTRSGKYDSYLTRFIANTVLTILFTWMERDFKESPDELYPLALKLLHVEL